MRSVLLLALALALGVSANPVAARQATGGPQIEVSAYLVVLAGRLNIRQAPSLDAPITGVALRGQRLCAVRYSGDWAEIRMAASGGGAPPRTVGFVSRGFVSEVRAEVAELERMGCRSS